ncbi:ABC transporter ATP-binding protein [Candidatus Protochlamydia naegleriophila]|uniref:ABC transporter ATP-binding protein n=1 Tax=Candidatus Protochlamydia naegleriophila TaxID=389348 RepID=A0A0U5JGL5_9BACT|nr:ABC-F family ATP-binding cassette domain-containing protein [Candidatus Protochlamydia naegleriophila]CUI17956.1 ABC transporter ATP-binding protein [Candidatus Protochlamydia naegleriophila]
MIQVDGLSLAYHGEALFEDASFSIQPGERCSLVGRNGAGKSSLFRLLTGQETPDKGTIAKRKNYIIGTLNQHIVFTKPTLIEEAALGLRPEEEDCIYKAETILFGLGFTEEDLDRSPQEFSGGYQLRLHLAKVLVGEPDCLLLDEPTNYLDIVSIRWFTKFLQEWKGEFILISHDREFLDSVSTHTMGIHRQKVSKFKGSTIDFFEQIMQKEEIYEKTRLNLEKKKEHLQGFIDRFGAKASKATQAASKQKQLSRIPVMENLKNLYQLDFQFNGAPFPGKKMLEVEDIAFAYDPTAEKPLIDHLSLLIEKGERVAIIGKNGRGKSTILRLLAGELNPLKGEAKRSDNLAIGYFGQTNIDRLHPKHTIEEEISSANSKLNFTQVKKICGLMMFSGDKSCKRNGVLSGGEKSRVLIGKIIATPCNLLLLDEPTHHLDMESIEALIDAIEDFEGAVIIVTHSELILKRMGLDKIVVCHEGRQELFLGTYEEFLDKNGWEE